MIALLNRRDTQQILYSHDIGLDHKCLTVRGHGYGAVAGGAEYAAPFFLIPL